MKKLLLLSAILIFACSSDEGNNDNNNSNQNFLQKYDGVIWKEILPSDSDIEWWYIFTQSSFTSCEAYTYDTIYDCDCSSENWGFVDEDGFYSEVIENSPERLVIETFEVDDDGETYNYITTAEATNNGNSLEVTYSDDVGYIEYYDRVSSNPCN